MKNNLNNILEEINSKNNITTIKNRMDLINYLSQFRNFLHTEEERSNYAHVLMVLKNNNIINDEYEDELFIILCVRKFIQEFELITNNFNNEKVIKYINEKVDSKPDNKKINNELETKPLISLNPELETKSEFAVNYNNEYDKKLREITFVIQHKDPYYVSIPYITETNNNNMVMYNSNEIKSILQKRKYTKKNKKTNTEINISTNINTDTGGVSDARNE